MLEAVETGLVTFEQAFLAHIVIPGTAKTLGNVRQPAEAFPQCLTFAKQHVCLPMHNALEEDDVEAVGGSLPEFYMAGGAGPMLTEAKPASMTQ